MTAFLLEGSSGARQQVKINPKPKPLPLTFFDAMEASPLSKEWITKNVIAKGEVSGWIGPPGVGKSIILGDLANHVCAGLDWHGFKTKGQFGVLYIALERGKLVERRIKAQANRDGLTGLPVAVSGVVLDMMNADCVEQVLATMEAEERTYNRKVELVIVDTVAKAVAAGSGNENAAEDMGKFLANVRRIIDKTGAHFALVGHTGKDVTKGARGSNAWLGDVNIEFTIKGEKVRSVEVTKANDQETGPLMSYRVESYYLGQDGDGDPVTIGIAAHHDRAANEMASPMADSKPGKKPLNHRQMIALNCLRDAIDGSDKTPPPSPYIPSGVRAVTWDTARIFFRAGSLSEGKDPDRGFRKLRDALQRWGYIGIYNDWIWLAE